MERELSPIAAVFVEHALGLREKAEQAALTKVENKLEAIFHIATDLAENLSAENALAWRQFLTYAAIDYGKRELPMPAVLSRYVATCLEQISRDCLKDNKTAARVLGLGAKSGRPRLFNYWEATQEMVMRIVNGMSETAASEAVAERLSSAEYTIDSKSIRDAYKVTAPDFDYYGELLWAVMESVNRGK
jgi:hypothetical protein